MIDQLLTEHHLECLSLKGGCRGSSEYTHVKLPHCWKSHALAQFYSFYLLQTRYHHGIKHQTFEHNVCNIGLEHKQTRFLPFFFFLTYKYFYICLQLCFFFLNLFLSGIISVCQTVWMTFNLGGPDIMDMGLNCLWLFRGSNQY